LIKKAIDENNGMPLSIEALNALSKSAYDWLLYNVVLYNAVGDAQAHVAYPQESSQCQCQVEFSSSCFHEVYPT